MSFGKQHAIRWPDITDRVRSKHLLAPIDRAAAAPKRGLAREWWRHGAVRLPGLLPDGLIDAYTAVRAKHSDPGGWRSPSPYVHVKELRDLCLHPPLMDALRELIGEPVGLHLNLTGWISTERDFHQDTYLNPAFVGTHYAAVWMALEDIHPDSGPFQFVPGSHRWPAIRRHLVFQYLTPDEQDHPAWPSRTQGWVASACREEIARRRAKIETYLPKRGDALVWHSNLIHRGSPPRVPGTTRRALIAHYSALSKRPDMPIRRKHANGEPYFYFEGPLE
ncbi:MAG: phytanoyl-CoA dioxygenase family protein [Elusimicrobia bacterium]|nr:phytanoyl-CoA dioxygenase family protein [Elusimicrobiota bacterium]